MPTSMSRVTLTELSDSELADLVQSSGGDPFRGRQLAHWVYRHGAEDLRDCRNLPGSLRDALAEKLRLRNATCLHTERSADGTEKLLVALADGQTVEAVLIPEEDHTTLCVSTQVGCPVGCIFCASGLDGVRRNLSAGEIVEQVLLGRARLPESRPLTNLVVMGMGEPLLNLEGLLPALERICDPAGINLAARRVTVSTSGYPGQIARLNDADRPYGLAVSLHSGDDRLRRRLLPRAQATVTQIVGAARAYGARKGRELTFEVVLLAGINDRRQDADALVRALRELDCTVNLIPWNPVDRITGLRRPNRGRVDTFAEWLRRGRLRVTLRRQRGADRSAACGQLRIRELSGSGPGASAPSPPQQTSASPQQAPPSAPGG
jgi:23S rRNA (adenine2503-C2)-methyltransferase